MTIDGTEDRFHVGSIVCGIVIATAVFRFVVAMLESFGFWETDVLGLPLNESRMFLALSIAWIISIFLGSFTAVRSIHTLSTETALLNAFVVWAGGYLVFIWMTGNFGISARPTNIAGRLFWGGFVGDVLSLTSAAAGALLCVRRRAIHVQARDLFQLTT